MLSSWFVGLGGQAELNEAENGMVEMLVPSACCRGSSLRLKGEAKRPVAANDMFDMQSGLNQGELLAVSQKSGRVLLDALPFSVGDSQLVLDSELNSSDGVDAEALDMAWGE